MEKEQQQMVKDVMKLITEDAPRKDILSSAKKAKFSLSKVWTEYAQAIGIVDTLVATYAPDPNWVAGWWNPDEAAKQVMPATHRPILARPPSRRYAILAIASSLMTSGKKRITVKAIMERLREQGDQRPTKAMAISIGNILAWSKQWRKVAPGEYEFIEQEEVE